MENLGNSKWWTAAILKTISELKFGELEVMSGREYFL